MKRSGAVPEERPRVLQLFFLLVGKVLADLFSKALKIFPDNEGRDGGCRLSFFPFRHAVSFLSTPHFLLHFLYSTQKYNEIKNILWAFFFEIED